MCQTHPVYQLKPNNKTYFIAWLINTEINFQSSEHFYTIALNTSWTSLNSNLCSIWQCKVNCGDLQTWFSFIRSLETSIRAGDWVTFPLDAIYLSNQHASLSKVLLQSPKPQRNFKKNNAYTGTHGTNPALKNESYPLRGKDVPN